MNREMELRMTEIDIPRLRKTLEWALSEHHKAERGEPSEWDQGEWLGSIRDSTLSKFYRSRPMPRWGETTRMVNEMSLSATCGTSCCIAGKIVLDAGYRPMAETGSTAWVRIGAGGPAVQVQTLAQKLLGGNPATLEALFSAGNDIHDLYRIASWLTDGAIEMPAELVRD